jgi:hypothetical protein
MEYYIYTLSDPISNQIKYVGKTKDLKDRLKRHMSDSYLNESLTLKNNWLKKLKSNNLKPIMEVLDQGDENNIDDLEIYWIEQLKAWGIKLKNGTKGGDGCDWTGRKHNVESVQKMKMNHPFRKTIYQYSIETDEIIAEFDSSHEAEEKTGLCRNHICKCCREIKNYNSVGGYYFRYKNNYFPYKSPNNRKCTIKQYKDGELLFQYNTTRELKKNGYNLESVKNSILNNRLYRDYNWEIIKDK